MAVSKIWRNIPESYNLIGKRCKCNALYFPKRIVCQECGAYDMEDYVFKGRGRIATYTIIRTPVSDAEHENIEISSRNIPYILAIVELEEGPRLTTQIVDTEKVGIGDNVKVVFRKILEKGEKGVIQYGYKFRLA